MDIFLTLAFWYQVTMVAVLGAIIGSFLNVVIYRFNTGRSLSGHSHCLSCGQQLTWYELIPVLSWLVQCGLCRHCGCGVTVRYLLVEASTSFLFVLAFLNIPFGLPLLVSLVLVSLLMVITAYDIAHLIIPDKLVWLTLLGALLWFWSVDLFSSETELWLYHLLGAVFAGGSYGALWLLSGGRWLGFGDVKLAVPLGLVLGASSTFSFIVLSFWVGAGVSLVLIMFQWFKVSRGKTRLPSGLKQLTMKSEVPFAPFIIIAFLLVFFWDVNVLQLVTFGW